MKPRCPACGSQAIHEVEGELPLVCDCGHRFTRCQALVSIEEAIVLAKALGHPTRRAILFAFGQQDEWSALELTNRLKTSTPHHVKILRETDPPIIVETRREQRRGATELYYKLNPELFDAGGAGQKRRKGSD